VAGNYESMRITVTTNHGVHRFSLLGVVLSCSQTNLQ